MEEIESRIDPEVRKQAEEQLQKIIKECLTIAEDRKAKDLRLYDVSKESMIADYYMICSGNSDPHIRAISGYIEKTLKDDYNLLPKGHDGTPQSGWMILDYPNLLIHIFHPEAREKYSLEKLWENGTIIYPESTEEEI